MHDKASFRSAKSITTWRRRTLRWGFSTAFAAAFATQLSAGAVAGGLEARVIRIENYLVMQGAILNGRLTCYSPGIWDAAGTVAKGIASTSFSAWAREQKIEVNLGLSKETVKTVTGIDVDDPTNKRTLNEIATTSCAAGRMIKAAANLAQN